ncbi:MAG TPA: phosphotransferase [Roseiflexaceae bacterium]|nr:phosphotransferase [Roseiflexaceae bacterium]
MNDIVSTEWLTALLRESGALTTGGVETVTMQQTDAFNSQTVRLLVTYSDDAQPVLPTGFVLKRNLPVDWAREAGVEEARFYQLVQQLEPAPPAVVPCYAAEIDNATGDSVILLEDLSNTHEPPITRDDQLSIVRGIPDAWKIDQVIETLAHQHAFWWQHSALWSGQFEVGYWTRNAERFAAYFERRRAGWELLLAEEASWFPDDLRQLYEQVFDGLERHWQRELAPRFAERRNLTLIHGDAYFTNFLVPREIGGPAYLLDWQSPSVDLAGYDLVNLLATYWTPEQRNDDRRELRALQRYHVALCARGVGGYDWNALTDDYRAGLICWLLMPIQDRRDGAARSYWWPKMECLAGAFRDWGCLELLG